MTGLFSKCAGVLALAAVASSVAASEPESRQDAAPAAQGEKDQAQAAWREVFPGIRINLVEKAVEFDGTVPVNAHTKAGLRVFLETTVCGYDSKEHESLVVTKAKPSQVHAALLLIGLKPGKPGAWRREEKKWIGVPPEGDEVEVKFLLTAPDGTIREDDPAEWIVNERDGKPLSQVAPDAKWVFAGSKLAQKKPLPRAPGDGVGPEPKPPVENERNGPEFYVADVEGTLIGLTSFGTETIGLTAMYNPDNDKEAPQWVASPEKTPEIGAKVTVRVSAKKGGA
ncbi:MAG: hypothetical protein KF691_06915 [Phycisphaeraceae bacterium]|nr:hypothetical protein [Phycisphaeraceae bacterium]